MLSSGDAVQQNKTKGRIINDTKDLCIYVDYSNGSSASVLGTGKFVVEESYYETN